MSEMKHTPLPWKMVSASNFENGNVYTSIQPVNVDEYAMKPLAMMNGEYHVCRMSHTAAECRFNYHRANAAFIVTACNSHYDNIATIAALKAENERLREALEKIHGFARSCEHDGGFDRETGPIGCNLGDRCVCIGYATVARAALTKQEG